MAEYIEREAAVYEIAKISNESNMPEDWHRGMSVAMSAVCRIPVADVVSVRHGRWISEPGHIPHCSECGKYSDDADTGEAICCPFCGARMDGDGDA